MIGGVVVGYITMSVAVFLLFSAGYLALGADGSLLPGTWDVSPAWLVLSIVVGLVAAIAGGLVCAIIAKNPKGALALAGLVVVLGLLFAIPVLMGEPEAVTMDRTATVSMFDAMSNAQQPVWIVLLNPLLGAIGVMIGACFKRDAASSDRPSSDS